MNEHITADDREILDMLHDVVYRATNKEGDYDEWLLNKHKTIKALTDILVGLIVNTQSHTAPPKQPEQESVTLLPDGSAFGVMSFQLPDSHWLYAEREYRDGEHEPIELGKPILTHELRDAVVSAVRYAIRGATNCGKEMDFDPDALVQNAVYALCGPYTRHVDAVNTSQERVDETVKGEQEPVASDAYDMIDRFLRNNLDDDEYAKYLSALETIYTAPPKQPEQEPVAWLHEKAGGYRYYSWQKQYPDDTPLFTAPPKREWQGLTSDDKHFLLANAWNKEQAFDGFMDAIDAFLKEKNT